MNPDDLSHTRQAASPTPSDAAAPDVPPDIVVPDPHPLTDADLSSVFRRALRLVAVLALLAAAILAVAAGWQTALLLLVGAAVSWTGIFEWRNLTNAVFDRLDKHREARPVGRAVFLFFLRLGLAAGVLYVSLRYVNGSVYALVGGLGLAVVALSFEALRLLRG